LGYYDVSVLSWLAYHSIICAGGAYSVLLVKDYKTNNMKTERKKRKIEGDKKAYAVMGTMSQVLFLTFLGEALKELKKKGEILRWE
jgi:hypothetical protein